jgi:hypothetical protein
MDPLLVSLVSAFESTRSEGVPWSFNLILFSGGRRYTGRLLTYEEFLQSTDWVLRTVAQGSASASPEAAPDPKCLHLAVSEIQDGEVVFSFEGLNLRFQLERIEAWTTGAIEA